MNTDTISLMKFIMQSAKEVSILQEQFGLVSWGLSISFSREMGVGRVVWAEQTAWAKAQKYEIA